MADPHVIETGLHQVTILPDVDVLFDVVFEDLRRAKRRIYLECYIVSSDRMGHELYVALDAAAKRGVDVRVLYDPLGSNRTDPAFFDDLRASGIVVQAYGRFGDLGSARDHGRVIVIDDVAYTGGAAWGDQWLPRSRGGRGWHDVCCRVAGPVVGDFVALFHQRFSEGAGDSEPADHDSGDRYPDLRLVADTPDRAHSLVYLQHEEAFRRAHRRIWIANAYFYPPKAMVEALAEAVKRGVDVRILLPGESDLPIIKRAARAEYAEWLEAGFLIWEYAVTVLHAKYAVVDDDWGSIGTFNANPTSVGLSNEVNLFFSDRTVIEALSRQFELDLTRADRVLAEDLPGRPITERVVDELSAAVWDAANRIWGPRD